jgi:hypothetical protein
MTIDPNRPSSGAAVIAPLSPSDAPEGQRLERPSGAVVDRLEGPTVRRLQVRGRAGVWEVLRDDRFYGHYMGYEAAFAAAEAAASAVVADGGAADIRFKEGRSQPGGPEPARGPAPGPIPAMRTMEFRRGMAPVVR